MKIKVKIKRCDPMATGRCEAFIQGYDIDAREGMTVLDALTWIKDELDGTLAFRRSCRSAICGSCAMMINDRPRLACKTQILREYDRCGEVRLAPLENFNVIKDLVVDLGPFWNKINSVEPWLNPVSEPTDNGWVITKEEAKKIDAESRCIMCGVCNGGCNSQEIDPDFIGPSASAKAYRFVGDVREGNKEGRLKRLSERHGIWDCTRCIMCNEYCPKQVNPMTAIEKLRSEAIHAGIRENAGARHVEAMVDSVKRVGRLDEAMYSFKSLGLIRSIGMLPQGIRLELHGKMPMPVIFPAIDGIEELRELFKVVEENEE